MNQSRFGSVLLVAMATTTAIFIYGQVSAIQIHDVAYLPCVICVVTTTAILLLVWPKQDPLSVDRLEITNIKPQKTVEGEVIQGMLEIFINGKWMRIHKHQLNEWLSDDQIKNMRELDNWRQASNATTPSETVDVAEEYQIRRDQIVRARPARKEVS